MKGWGTGAVVQGLGDEGWGVGMVDGGWGIVDGGCRNGARGLGLGDRAGGRGMVDAGPWIGVDQRCSRWCLTAHSPLQRCQ